MGVKTGISVGLVSTYPPTRCGIATFAAHLRTGLLEAGARAVPVVASVRDGPSTGRTGEVLYALRREEVGDYRAAAEALRTAGVDLVLLQHEFGIYGGRAGTMIQELLQRLHVPVIATLHTVLVDPDPPYRHAMQQVLESVDCVVVMAERAVEILRGIYGFPACRIEHIPHGVPTPPPGTAADWKRRLGLEGQTVVMTFGLIGPGKGIEVALQAIAQARCSCPDLLYLVVGATHPEVARREGERYRHGLEALVSELDIGDHVRFVDRYLDEDELLGYLQACDVYVSPYPGAQQITSGTLTYALAMGKPVVSTPYAYARELLAGGVGLLVPFHDSGAMAQAIAALARDPQRRAVLGTRARRRTQGFRWRDVARRYLALAERLTQRRPGWARTTLPAFAEGKVVG